MKRSEELAWAAGFLDGEGCLAARKNLYPILGATQVRVEPLLRLQALWGGRIYPAPARGNHQARYEWMLWGFPRVQNAVAQVWTWLSPQKKEQFSRGLVVAATNKYKWQVCSALGHSIRKYAKQKFCGTCADTRARARGAAGRMFKVREDDDV